MALTAGAPGAAPVRPEGPGMAVDGAAAGVRGAETLRWGLSDPPVFTILRSIGPIPVPFSRANFPNVQGQHQQKKSFL